MRIKRGKRKSVTIDWPGHHLRIALGRFRWSLYRTPTDFAWALALGFVLIAHNRRGR